MALPIFELGLIFVFGAVLSYVVRGLRQPLILAYVAAGMVIGPVGLGLVTDMDSISVLAELGVAFLLFVAGLQLDFSRMKGVSFQAMVGAAVQIILTFLLGIAAASLLGLPAEAGFYAGLLLAFSSTMIVAKFLISDNEIDTLHGRTMLAILFIQDIVAVVALTFLAMGSSVSFSGIAWVIGGVGALLVGAYALNRLVFSRLMESAAGSKEMLFFTALAVCFLFMGFAYGMGLSIAIGAFIAGISLAGLRFNAEISGEMAFVRDFFGMLFFATLGMQLNPVSVAAMPLAFAAFLALIIIVKPFILSATYMALGYGSRAAVATGTGMGQAGEFVFIIAAVGLKLGQIGAPFYSLMISLVVVSMVATPYLMRSGSWLGCKLSKTRIERIFKPTFLMRMETAPKGLRGHIVVIGAGVTGTTVMDFLASKKREFVAVEWNPDVARALNAQGIYTVFGDASHTDVLERAGIRSASAVVITLPDAESGICAVREAKRGRRDVKVYARAHTAKDAELLKEAGADFITVPQLVSGEELIRRL